MAENPKVKLLYPPYSWAGWDGPHLAMPLLCTYLRSVGIDCSYVDLNVRFRHYLTRPEGEIEEFAITRLNEYLSYQQMDSLASDKMKDVKELLKVISTLPSDLVQEYITKRGIVGKLHDGAGIGPVDMDLAVAQLGELREELPGLSEGVSALIQNRTYRKQPILERFLNWGPLTDEVNDALTADVVGINISFSVQLGAALTIAHFLKERAGHLTVVLGGTQVTLLPTEDQDALAALPFVDGVVVFEGELPLEKLAWTVTEGGSLEQIPNLIARLEDGNILRTEPTSSLHPNDVPTPQLNEAELPLYGDTPQFTLLATRGCYWGKCSYCDYVRLLHPGHFRYLCRAPESVVRDAEFFIEKYGARRFWLVTDALPPKWTKNFCREIVARGVRAEFSSYMRTEKVVKPEFVRLMKRAGFTAITLGAESFTDRVLEVMKKGTTGDDVERNLRLLADSGIKVTLNMIPDYPTTTFEEAIGDMRNIIENAPWIEALNGGAFDLTDGTEVAMQPEKFGILVSSAEGCVSSSHGAHSLRFKRTTGMTSAEHRRLMTAFRKLTRQLPRLRASGANRLKVRHELFDWEKSRLRFLSFVPLPSRFSIVQGGSWGDVTILLIPILKSYVEIPAYHERVLTTLLSAGRSDVPYPNFRSAFVQDVGSIEPDMSDEDLDRRCRDVVVDFVDAGFIDHVSGGGVDHLESSTMPSPPPALTLEQVLHG